jgi:hypothetical protein
MKKYIINLILLFILINIKSESSIKHTFIYIGNGIYKILSNKFVQTYVADALFIYGEGVCNAKTDGYLFDKLYGDGKTFGVSDKNWHSYKNIGRTCTWSAIILKGIGLGQHHFTLKKLFIEGVSVGLISNVVWHKVYYRSRYGSYWNTDYAQNYFIIPYGKNDIKIGLKGNQVYVADGIQLGLGIGGLIISHYP